MSINEISVEELDEFIDNAGSEALPLLHKLAYPNCKFDYPHCHKGLDDRGEKLD